MARMSASLSLPSFSNASRHRLNAAGVLNAERLSLVSQLRLLAVRLHCDGIRMRHQPVYEFGVAAIATLCMLT
jgi:hypothetical protein